MGLNKGYEVVPARWIHSLLPCGGYSVGLRPPLSKEHEGIVRKAGDLGFLLGQPIVHEYKEAGIHREYAEMSVSTRDIELEDGEDNKDAFGRAICSEADARACGVTKLIVQTLIENGIPAFTNGVIRPVGNGQNHFSEPTDEERVSELASAFAR